MQQLITGKQMGVVVRNNINNNFTELYKDASKFANIDMFGAVGDGMADDSIWIQAAIDSLSATGGTVLIPPRTYIANDIHLKSNVNLLGIGSASVLVQKTGLSGYSTLLGINHDGAGTVSTTGSTDLDGDVKNIHISNLKLKGNSVVEGFSEFVSLVSLTSCSNIVIDNVVFEGFRGDAVFIGILAQTGQRHNNKITIKNCYFDGVNKLNRNAISVTNGQNILIEDNIITRCSKSDMPGAIDIEMDNNPTAVWTMARNILVRRNTIFDIGSNGLLLSSPTEQSYKTIPTNNICFDNNLIYDVAFVGIVVNQKCATMADAISRLDFKITNNMIRNCSYPINVNGAHGVTIENNVAYDCNNSVMIGDVYGCKDVSIRRNTLERLGNGDESGISLGSVSYVTIDNNTIKDCGFATDAGFAVSFISGKTSDNVYIFSNRFLATSAPVRLTHATYKGGTHVLTPATNKYYDNQDAGLTYVEITDNMVALSATTGTISVAMNERSKTLVPTGACTLNATGGVKGQRWSLIITTSGTTSYVITFGTNFKSTGTLTTGTVTAKVFTVEFIYTGSTWVEVSRTTAM